MTGEATDMSGAQKMAGSPVLSTRSRLLAAAVASCFVGAVQAGNLPTGGVVGAGSASFNQAGNVLTIRNSDGTIINWNTFSIGSGYTTNFLQASSSSSVLNRVISGDQSVILGTLTSNGRVFLINPNGIMIGKGARIDVGGFVAGLGLTDADFLARKLKFFTPDGAIGSITNQGTITTPSGGSVYLVAPSVNNDITGIITTPQGETILAAGQTVTLVDTGTPGVSVQITGTEGNATNLGDIVADAGRIGIAGVLVRNSGTLNASSVTKKGGQIFLRASQDAFVDGDGRIVTTGTKGGRVEVLGNHVAVKDNAVIDASGEDGGGVVLIGGDYQGKNPKVQNAQITYVGAGTSINANANNKGKGGKVVVWADDTTRAYGSIEAKGGANGGNGGLIETSGHKYLDVSGISVNTLANAGRTGTWLLDPTDITIKDISDTANLTSGYFYGGSASTSNVSWTTIQSALNSSDVVIQTDVGSTGYGTGSITIADAPTTGGLSMPTINHATASDPTHPFQITPGIKAVDNKGHKLSMLASGSIDVNASFGVKGTGSTTIVAGWDGSGTSNPNTVAMGTSGTDINLNNSFIAIDKGNLTIKTPGTISINAGSSGAGIDLDSGTLNVSALGLNLFAGTFFGAQIAGNNNQTFTLGDSSHAGQLLLQAGGGNTGYGAMASIERYLGGSGGNAQTFNINGAGGTVAVNGGSGSGVVAPGQWSGDCSVGGCGGNMASIQNDTTGKQVFNFAYGGSSLAVVGGSGGGGNSASIQSEGDQLIGSSGSAPNITVSGGTGGSRGTNDTSIIFSNDASIESKTKQSIYGGNLVMTGGGDSNTYGGAFISAPTIRMFLSGSAAMYGGGSDAAGEKGFGAPAIIGNEHGVDVKLDIGGGLYISGGSGNTSGVGIGSLDGTAKVAITTGSSVFIDSNLSGVALGSLSSIRGTLPGSVNIGSGVSIVSANGDGEIFAYKDVNIDGKLDFSGYCGDGCTGLKVEAGYSSTGGGYNAVGGNIRLGANSQIFAGYVHFGAYGGGDTLTGGINGTIVQQYGGQITIVGDQFENSEFLADGNMLLDGTLTLTDKTHLFAAAGYGFRQTRQDGRTLRIATLAAPALGSYSYTPGFRFNSTGDISLGVSGGLDFSNISYGFYGGTAQNNLTISATGPVTMRSYVNKTGLSVSGVLSIISGGDVLIAGDSVYGGFNLSGDKGVGILAGGNVTLNDGSCIHSLGSSSSDVTIITQGSLTLNNGSYIEAAHDAILALNGNDSQVVLNSGKQGPSYISTRVAQTTHINFLKRSVGGILIDDVDTSVTEDGGSGFYASGSPASPGNGLAIEYGISLPPSGPTETPPDPSKSAEASKVIDQFFTKLTDPVDNTQTADNTKTSNTSDDKSAKGKKKTGNTSDNEGNDNNETHQSQVGHC